jgi:iron uptake system EfeUOB component EfeO/EfeM
MHPHSSEIPLANCPATRPHMPRRGRRAATIVMLVVVAMVATACSSATSLRAARPPAPSVPVVGPEAGVTSRYGTDVSGGSKPTTLAAQAATHAFSAQVDADTAAFVAAVVALASASAIGDIGAARGEQLAAQTHYDAFRVLETGNAVNASTLDQLATDVVPTSSFGGLHAVERDLWGSGPLLADVSALAGQAPVAQFLLSRERLGPEAIAVVAVDQLDWVVDVALPHGQEHYSRLGLVDVVATEQAAHRSFTTIDLLARMVAPALTATVEGQFTTLDSRIASLGPANTVPDSSLSTATRLAVSRQLDVTASTLARLAARLTLFGTAGAPS